MILKKIIERDNVVAMFFERTDGKKTVTELVAEVIVAHGNQLGGVLNAEIHYADPSHPFSGTQRLREMAKRWRCIWPGINMPPNKSAYHYDHNHYIFNPDFVAWVKKEYL